eukprot:gene23614-biopygen10364
MSSVCGAWLWMAVDTGKQGYPRPLAHPEHRAPCAGPFRVPGSAVPPDLVGRCLWRAGPVPAPLCKGRLPIFPKGAGPCWARHEHRQVSADETALPGIAGILLLLGVGRLAPRGRPGGRAGRERRLPQKGEAAEDAMRTAARARSGRTDDTGGLREQSSFPASATGRD